MINQDTAQQIVSAVKDVCGYDINYISTSGVIIASTNEKRIGDFHEAGYMAARSQETLEVADEQMYDGTWKGVNIPFTYHGETIGVIGITGDPDKVRIYARLAVRIMRLILRERDLDTSREMRKAEFAYIVRALVHGQSISHSHLIGFLEERGLDFQDLYRVIRIRSTDRENTSNLSRTESRVENILGRFQNGFYAYEYPDQYILILQESAWQEQKQILQELKGMKVRAAVGSACRLSRASESYRDAGIAFRGSDEQIIEFDSLYLELILSRIPEREKQAYLQRTTEKLNDKDREVLKAYYGNNMSLKETAQQLYIHKNTLQYQLDRIHTKTGLDPRAFADAEVLDTALKLD